MSKNKKMLTGFLLVIVVVTGVFLIPKFANAEDIKVGEIIYSSEYSMAYYWKEDGTKTAPVRPGYVFGGWYEKEDDQAVFTAISTSSENAWAKFVPDYVLSVRAQNEDGTTQADQKNNSVRVLSAVDSKDYQYVGFDIWLANKKQLTMTDENGAETAPLKTNKIFSGIKVQNKTVTATETFGETAKYFSVWRLDEIQDSNDSKIIYVRPYWITHDGTKVEGLAKYVHVEDEYLNYVSVPINLVTKQAIAAGIVKMEYATSLKLVGFEPGRLLTEMTYNDEKAGVLRIAGNAETAYEEISADGIYANLRFEAPDDLSTLKFTLSEDADFSDWTKEFVKDIIPIIQY